MPIIDIYVKGGVIQDVAIPRDSNVVVRVVDYDCENGECAYTDDEGTPCNVAIYEAQEKKKETQ